MLSSSFHIESLISSVPLIGLYRKKRVLKGIVLFIDCADTWSNRTISEEVIKERSENDICPYYEQYSS